MVEEMLAARGISVTHETIRQWGLKFGREFANRIRRRAPRRGDKCTWMRSSSASPGKSIGSGVPFDQDGLRSRYSRPEPARQEGRQALVPQAPSRSKAEPLVCSSSDKLKSYAAAKREIMPGVEHRQHKGLNNRAETPINRPDDESGS